MRPRRSLTLAIVSATALVAVAVSLALASPATNVTPTVLARGTFDSFKVMSNPDNGGLFKAEAKAPIDFVIRQHTYAAGGSTGWHAHPYPVFITVKQGTLTFYEYDDPTCTPIVVSAGQGYVDSGRGHIARNETASEAVDISVIMAPVGAAFRSELSAPNPNCGF
jgi:quercetin dioxygenase-like cupin family protein